MPGSSQGNCASNSLGTQQLLLWFMLHGGYAAHNEAHLYGPSYKTEKAGVMTIVLTCINALSSITVSYALHQAFIIIALWSLTLLLQYSFGRTDALRLSSMSIEPTKYSCPVSSILLHTNSECACIMKA